MTTYDSMQRGTFFQVYDVNEGRRGSSDYLRFIVRHNGKYWEAHTRKEVFNRDTGRFEREDGEPIKIQPNDRHDYNKIAGMLGLE
jgi:hypothetical protein